MSAAVSTRRHLSVLTNSSLSCYRRCAREYYYRYTLLRRPRKKSDALKFGSLFHVGLNAWWRAEGGAEEKYMAAIGAMADAASEVDEFELVKAEELMLGYTARWGDERYTTVAVEQRFDVPFCDVLGVSMSGSLDVLAERNGKLYIIEHKTTSADIDPGSTYWLKVSGVDSQVSTYHAAMKDMGREAEATIYDVVRKVDLRPRLATPEDKRKYTKGSSKACPFCKKTSNVKGPHLVSSLGEPEQYCVDGRIITSESRLYADQRETDESAEEYRERIRDHIAANPEHYFARAPIVRLERDEREHANDVWQTATMMALAAERGLYPRNAGSCERLGRLCSYFEVCSGQDSIDNDIRFRTAKTAHEELEREV
jgi:hypothetical protein